MNLELRRKVLVERERDLGTSSHGCEIWWDVRGRRVLGVRP